MKIPLDPLILCKDTIAGNTGNDTMRSYCKKVNKNKPDPRLIPSSIIQIDRLRGCVAGQLASTSGLQIVELHSLVDVFCADGGFLVIYPSTLG